jgi:WD40 repeat protein
MTRLATALLMAAMLQANIVAQNSYETFNKALAAEKTNSDLRVAIRLYEQAVRQAGKDRQLAAKAWLRIGDCYRRLGDAQARTAFTRILNDYADQADVVSEARTRLDATDAAPDRVRLMFTREGAIAFDGLITADGRLPGTDWSNGDVVFVDVLTRAVTRVVAGGGTGADPWGENPLLSPDRKLVAYQWFEESSRGTLHQLRIVAVDRGAKPRVLVDDLAAVHNIYPLAWSADARRLLVQYQIPSPPGSSLPGKDLQLAWVSTADGTMTPIKRLEWWRSAGQNSLGLISLSPDGRQLAYSAAPAQGSNDRSIYVMGIDGTTPIEVASGGVNEAPVWTRDGRRLIFVSDRAGAFGVWTIQVQNGKSNGFVSAVKMNTGRVDLHGVTPAGVLYYSAYTRVDETFVAPLARDGRLTSGSSPTESTPGNNVAWSPDGKFLAFKRRHDGRFDLVVRNMETAKEMKWSGNTALGRPLGNFLIFWMGNTRIMADAQTIVEVVGDELRRASDSTPLRGGTVSRDGSALYVTGGENDLRVNIVDPSTGQPKGSIVTPEHFFGVAINPSGDTLALINSHRMSIVRVDGTGFRDVYVAPAGRSPLASTVKWAGDGRTLLFASDDGGQLQMMRVSIDGGRPEPAGLLGSGANRFDVSRDGTRIAYTNRREAVEVWSLPLDGLVNN